MTGNLFLVGAGATERTDDEDERGVEKKNCKQMVGEEEEDEWEIDGVRRRRIKRRKMVDVRSSRTVSERWTEE